MTTKPDPLTVRKEISFEQAEGVEPLPTQLKPKEISKRLRALLWEVIYLSLQRHHVPRHSGGEFLEPWGSIFYALHVHREHGMIDEFENDSRTLFRKTKQNLENGNYLQVFGWIQYVLRHGPPNHFAEQIQAALEGAGAAYRVVDSDTIMPFGSEAERETIERAFVDLATTEFYGARKHLHNAAEALTAGKSAASGSNLTFGTLPTTQKATIYLHLRRTQASDAYH